MRTWWKFTTFDVVFLTVWIILWSLAFGWPHGVGGWLIGLPAGILIGRWLYFRTLR